MRKFLFVCLFLISIFSIFVFKYASCEDNLLAVNVIPHKEKAKVQPDEVIQKEDNADKAREPMAQLKQDDDCEKDLEKIKAYHELIDNKQKELEVIKLDLEKNSLLLKKKEAEKEIFEIDKALPQAKKGISEAASFIQDVKEPLVEPSDIKVQLLLISDNLKEGIISLKGTPYSFKEGDSIASKLTVETIDSSGIAFKQPDGSILKVNFTN